jgi:mono/diheme cytochrome c family protein
VQTPEDRFYNPAKINAWFAAAAILTLAATAAAVLADHYDREWKGYQHSFQALEKKRAEEAVALDRSDPAAASAPAAAIRDRLLLKDVQSPGNLPPEEARKREDKAFAEAVEALRREADFPLGAAVAARAYDEAAKALETPEFLKRKAELEAVRDAAENDRFKTEKTQRELKAVEDALKFSVDHAASQGHAHEAEIAEKEWSEVAAKEKEVHAKMDAFALQKENAKEEIRKHVEPVATLRGRARRLRDMGGVLAAEKKLAAYVVQGLRDAPLLDPFAPVTKIEQKVFPDLTEDYNFAQIGRVDRCITCHKGIDKVSVDPQTGEVTPLYTEANTPERVFRTHPNPKLYVSSVSEHALDKVGCTVCHGGLGWGLSFADAYHTPNTAAQEKEWEEKFHWHRGESWTNPMLPMKYIESSCFKCHRDQAQASPEDKFIKEIPQAPLWNRGLEVVEKSGCFGCHKIDGFAVAGLDKWVGELAGSDPERHGRAMATSIRKTGPSLLRVASKWPSKAAVHKWIWEPRSLRPGSNMPRFFGQPNNSGSDPVTGNNYDARSRAEAWGLAEYVWSLSDKEWKPGAPPVKGDAARGKVLFGGDLEAEEIVRSIGCVACHTTKDFPHPEGGTANDFGPDLSTVGSKTSEAWIYAWLKGPSHVWAGTRMPDLRLSDQQAADIAAYLASLRDEAWEKAVPEPFVEGVVRDLAVEAQRAWVRPGQDPEKIVEAATPEQRLLMVGERAMQRYACFGCHEVKGYENRERIGTELGGSEGWGSKDVDRLDFGLLEDPKAVKTYAAWGTDKIGPRPEGDPALPHRKPEWARLKLLSPRIFDAGVTKQPHEKLLMPNFSFTEEQADAVTCFLLSLQKGEVPAAKRPVRDARAIQEAKLLWVARQYNCFGCHVMKVAEREGWNPKKGEPGEKKGDSPKGMKWTFPVGKGGDVRPWLGEDGDHWPPSLGGDGTLDLSEGARVQPAWLFEFLKHPEDPKDPSKNMLRYWLDIRMPTFPLTTQERTAIVQGFAAQDGVPFPYEEQPFDEKDLEEAKAIFDQVQCYKCHRMEGKPKPSGFAPDLTYTRSRLRHDWVRKWFESPLDILKGTKMPMVWGSREQVWGDAKHERGFKSPDGLDKAYYGNDPHEQMRKVADYVWSLGKGPGESGTK